jgi:hypothetical protein
MWLVGGLQFLGTFTDAARSDRIVLPGEHAISLVAEEAKRFLGLGGQAICTTVSELRLVEWKCLDVLQVMVTWRDKKTISYRLLYSVEA